MGRFITGAPNSPVALATDGAARLWLAYVYENAGTYTLKVSAIHEDQQEYTIQANIGTPYDLDAVYNPAAQTVDLLLSSDIGVEWLRWDPTAGALDNSAIINGASSGCVDLELNPATGRPAALFAMGFNHMYCELTAAEAIEKIAV